MAIDSRIQPTGVFGLFLRMGGWGLIITAIVLLVLYFGAQSKLTVAQRFEANGVPVIATVIRKYTKTDQSGDNNKTTYWVSFRYSVQGGQALTTDRKVARQIYFKTEPGASFALEYLPDDPKKLQVTPDEHRHTAEALQLVFISVGTVWLYLLWWIGRKAAAGELARRHGARYETQSLGLAKSKVSVNRETLYQLVWRTPEDEEARSVPRKRTKFSGVEVAGTPITIYRGRGRDWWAGDVGNRFD